MFVADHIDVDQRFQLSQRAVRAPLVGQMAAAIDAIRIAPVAHRLLAVEEDQVDVVAASLARASLSQLEQHSRGGRSVVCPHEPPAGELLCIEVAGNGDGFAARAGKFDDDVGHGDLTTRSLRDERIFRGLGAFHARLLQNVGLELLVGLGAGGARAKADGVAGVFEGGVAGERRGGGRTSPEKADGDHGNLRAEHIYPSVKFRRRSSGSSSGKMSAGGTKNSAASAMDGPGKNCRAFNSLRESRRKKPLAGRISRGSNPACRSRYSNP